MQPSVWSESNQNKKGMDIKDIAIFKHFIAEKDIRKPFINCYNGSKSWAKLPDSIEEFFSNVDAPAVIAKGCRVCRPNSAYDYSFWQSLSQDWQEHLKKMQASDFYQRIEQPELLTGFFKILRENWNDAKKPWVYEDTNLTRQRLGLSFPEPVFKVGDTIKGSFSGDVVTVTQVTEKGYFTGDGGFIELERQHFWSVVEPEERKEQDDSAIEFSDDTEGDDGIVIDFVEFVKGRKCRRILTKGTVSVTTRKTYRLTVNRTDSKEIFNKKVKFAMIGNTRTGDTMIQFCNNDKGIPLAHSKEDYANINSVQFIENLRRLLSITEDFTYLNIEKVSEKLDSITYKVTKQ